MNGQIIIACLFHVMIIDLTDAFYAEAATSRTARTQSNWHSSLFIKTATSYLADLTSLYSKLNDLEKCVRSGSRFEREAEAKRILNVKQHLKLCEQNIKRLKSAGVDIKSRKQTAEQLKESILIAMELKLLQATFRFKDIHLAHSRKGAKEPTAPAASAEREINLNRPLFLEQAQSEVQETAIREYKEIEKSIHEITEMYKETVSVVRLQELLVDSIDGFIDDADTNVKSGKRNLAELNSKEQQNRKLIYKVFGFLYFIVFVYLVFLA